MSTKCVDMFCRVCEAVNVAVFAGAADELACWIETALTTGTLFHGFVDVAAGDVFV